MSKIYIVLERSKVIRHNYIKLIITSAIVALFSVLLAFSLKHLTEFFESRIFEHIVELNKLWLIVLPSVGITAIYFIRKYLFYNRKNKGITEIYKTLDERKEHLPWFKIPSHYLNGFLTVIFGGSTGVEVSTVVATAALGNTIYEKEFSARVYKRELICAGVTAGITVLFVSPLAGWLFAMEVIARKVRPSLLISCSVAALVAGLFTYLFDNENLLSYHLIGWSWKAVPFFLILSLLGGTLSAYFTILVIRIKHLFSKINNNFLRVNLGALTVGLMIYFFPSLYGDSYEGLKEVLQQNILNMPTISFLSIFIMALLKPLAASFSLGAGGDGGVFAPSIVAGAFLGLVFAAACNQWFGTQLILINFALVGAAATLSASIYAPLTTIFLVCNLIPNGYVLFIPIVVASFIAKYFSKLLLPYNVYNYDFYLKSKEKNVLLTRS